MAQYLPIIQVLIGGILTLGGGYVATALHEHRRQTREAKSLALAFRGEIVAIRTIVARRKYLEGISNVIEHIRRNNEPRPYTIHVRREYFNVFSKNVDKLGTLTPPLPELIATFYTQANSMLEDIESIRSNELGSDVANQLFAYEELYALARDTLRLADEIVEQIGKQYP